ncbi:MAG TPA: hypothetical protein VKX96_03255 [Chloroflexota bacterium]|nr:hypothetical protein [Chloroflexota bacterium]
MDIHPRHFLERVELVTLIGLVVAAPLLEILDVLGVFRTSIGPTLLVLLVANLAAVLIALDARIFRIDENVQVIRQTVRQDVAIHREEIYVEIIHQLYALTVDRHHLPVRLYTPAGAWIADATYRWWYGQLADLVRNHRIILIAAYGLTESQSEFERMRKVLEDDFGAMDREWCTEGMEKGALFHLFPPSPPRPGFSILMAGQQVAILGFPITPGFRGAERALIISSEEPVGALLTWFDNEVRPYAQPLNLTECLVDGLRSFAQHYYPPQAA